jgi:hypothetical protein
MSFFVDLARDAQLRNIARGTRRYAASNQQQQQQQQQHHEAAALAAGRRAFAAAHGPTPAHGCSADYRISVDFEKYSRRLHASMVLAF